MTFGSSPPDESPWDDFLSSSPQSSSATAIPCSALRGRRILITGAGGYLGSAVAQAIAASEASSLCLLDIVEHGLYLLQDELETKHIANAADFLVGSVSDVAFLREVFTAYRPEIVLHAAALKHVPLMQKNGLAAALTNILGTERVLAAASRFGATRFLLLSTDKAVDAISLMGATKRIAELLTLTSRTIADARVIRLCNVLGSSGSVAPSLARQIERGQPVTVTDPAATRWFISRDEAVSCMLAALSGTEALHLTVPRRAERRAVIDLATHLLRRAHQPASRIDLTHLRPGERLHERLWSSEEIPLAGEDDSPLQRLSSPGIALKDLEKTLAEITQAVDAREYARLVQAMATIVPSAFEVPV